MVLTGSAFAFGAQGELELGVSSSNIEQDARRSQTVRKLEVAKAINDNLCAMVFYDDKSFEKHTFSIYVKGDGLRLGYFFRIGGSSSEIAEDYREFAFEDKGSAILSMNKNGYRQIQYDNGAGVTKIDIDPAKPFALVLPADCFMVMLTSRVFSTLISAREMYRLQIITLQDDSLICSSFLHIKKPPVFHRNRRF